MIKQTTEVKKEEITYAYWISIAYTEYFFGKETKNKKKSNPFHTFKARERERESKNKRRR